MNDSILVSIKKLLGIAEEITDFDMDIIIHINSVFSILKTMGVGPVELFKIEDDSSKWSDFIENKDYLEMVKTYMYLKVKGLFDPSLSSSVQQAYDAQAKELEWRMYAFEDNSAN